MKTNYINLILDDSALYEYTVALEGNSYTIEMQYNERSKLYCMYLYNSDREAIASAAVVPGYPIMLDYALPNLSGFFLLIQNGQLDSEPYKEFPDKLSQYYTFVYTYQKED